MSEHTKKDKLVFFQPILTEEEQEKAGLFSVYRSYENAKADYPDAVIGAYTEEQISNPLFIDDENDLTPTYYVDIPQCGTDGLPKDEWRNIADFKIKQEAIDFAIKYLGADENGMISVISVS